MKGLLSSDCPRVVLVEDDAFDAELAGQVFDSIDDLDIDLIWLGDGEKASVFFKELVSIKKAMLWHDIRLILLDLKMPKLNGFEILSQLKHNENLKHIPTVILSSSNEEEDVVRAYDLGVNAYLIKPVDYTLFKDVIKSAANFWVRHNRSPYIKGS